MNEWDRLRDDWIIGRGEDYATDERGWVVYQVDGGEFYRQLGWGKTIVEAIEAAEAYAAEEERREAERWADYERRKAAGKLTLLERAGEWTSEIWAPHVLAAVESDTVLGKRVARDYEGEVVTAGDTIEIPKVREIG